MIFSSISNKSKQGGKIEKGENLDISENPTKKTLEEIILKLYKKSVIECHKIGRQSHVVWRKYEEF